MVPLNLYLINNVHNIWFWSFLSFFQEQKSASQFSIENDIFFQSNFDQFLKRKIIDISWTVFWMYSMTFDLKDPTGQKYGRMDEEGGLGADKEFLHL